MRFGSGCQAPGGVRGTDAGWLGDRIAGEVEPMIACKATTKSGKPCPSGASYVDEHGGTWCHVHADRAACSHITKRDRQRGELSALSLRRWDPEARRYVFPEDE